MLDHEAQHRVAAVGGEAHGGGLLGREAGLGEGSEGDRFVERGLRVVAADHEVGATLVALVVDELVEADQPRQILCLARGGHPVHIARRVGRLGCRRGAHARRVDRCHRTRHRTGSRLGVGRAVERQTAGEPATAAGSSGTARPAGDAEQRRVALQAHARLGVLGAVDRDGHLDPGLLAGVLVGGDGGGEVRLVVGDVDGVDVTVVEVGVGVVT